MEFLTAISPGWIGSMIGLLGLIGLVITSLLYRASRVGPRPVYQYQSLRLIGRKEQALPEEVTILFKDKKVQRLTKTHIILWNSGNATLNGENIVADDPLRLEFSKEGQVLTARIASFTRKSNKFTANINPHCPNEVICSFDYLNTGDGAVLELLHTAKERYPTVEGSIRGVPKGLSSWGRIFPSPELKGFPFRARTLKIFSVFGLLFGMFSVAYGVMRPTMPGFVTVGTTEWRGWVFVMFGLIFIGVYSFFLWVSRRRFPKSLSIENIE